MSASISRHSVSALPVRALAPTPFLTFLKTLTYVVGLTLGLGGTMAWLWNRYLLPLLYSSFSARKAIGEQRVYHMRSVVDKLRAIRSQRLYGPISLTEMEESGKAVPQAQAEAAAARHVQSVKPWASEHPVLCGSTDLTGQFPKALEDSLLIEEMSTAGHPTPPTRLLDPSSSNHASMTTQPKTLIPPHPSNDSGVAATTNESFISSLDVSDALSILPKALSELSDQMAATETTRTSLLSTLTAYTSYLHTQNFMMLRSGGAGGAGNGSVGLTSLSANLAREGGVGDATGTNDGPGEKEVNGNVLLLSDLEEYDAVKKEIRGMKGLLLSR